MNDKFPSVFIDSDKPELVCGIKQEKNVLVNRHNLKNIIEKNL